MEDHHIEAVACDLAVIVIAVAARPQLIEAVRSLQRQGDPLEIVVVNSGGGDAAALLRQAGMAVPVVESAALLSPGAARNRGIKATRAPYVAFLAEDCLAAPGWSAKRIALHRSGRPAVASALVNDRTHNPIAWAGHLFLFVRRLPGTPRRKALTYGASYARALFDRRGLFREDMRTGEDTEFHRRLKDKEQPLWRPSIVTVHRSPKGLAALLRDQVARGRRSVRAWRQMAKTSRRELAAKAVKRSFTTIGMGYRWVSPGERVYVVLAAPFILLAAAAYLFGVLTAKPAAD